MKTYILKSSKNKLNQKLINEALDILESVGIPLPSEKKQRSLENIGMCFLAVAGISKSWKQAKSLKDDWHLTTREIIKYVNQNFEENKSSGSYDDIKRKYLKLPVSAGLVINSGKNPKAATNDPTRRYSLDNEFKDLILSYGTRDWEIKLKLFLKNRKPIAEILESKRNIEKIPVVLPGNIRIELSKGRHNELQREIIDQFLPRFGDGCEILYIGDTSKKILHIEEKKLKELNFFELSHDELPDIVAYNKNKNWLYLIEAVHSSGPMSGIRVLELKKLLKNCKADAIFITAFISRTVFKKWMLDIASETEVWTADMPDHLIHFNGHKFLGPY